MMLAHHVYARSMLRGHAAFWRHAQTVALATIIPEIKLAIASACHALLHAYFVFVLPSHCARPSAISVSFSSIFMYPGYHAPVVRPRSLALIVAIATGVLRGMGHLRHERAHPVGRRPRVSCFAEVQGTLFLAFGQFTKRGFSATTFLGARRVLWSRTPRHNETSNSVMPWCPTPQNPTGTGPLCGPAGFH